MSLFSNIFQKNSPTDKPNFPWISIQDLGVLQDLNHLSLEKPIFIFKHSTRCSISRFSLKQFENDALSKSEDCRFYFLDLISYRNVSNAIAERFNVIHQSPQLIVLWKNHVVYSASHSEIDFENAISEVIK